MTIDQILKSAIIRLKARGLDSPHLEAEILLSHVLKKSREFLLANSERKISSARISRFKLLLKRRLKGEPIAYLTGHKEFYGLTFKVNKNVLIPRPETELMIDEALKLIAHSSRPKTFVDVGTGSGCIIITLAKLTKNYKYFGLDISEKALTVAKQNSKHHDLAKKIKFLHGDLLKPLLKNKLVISHWSLVILANLPYLTPIQIKNSPSIKHEPKSALNGGIDGLKYYRQLFKQIKTLPSSTYLLCEIDPSQTSRMKQLIKRELPKASCQIKKDLGGLNRLAVIKII